MFGLRNWKIVMLFAIKRFRGDTRSLILAFVKFEMPNKYPTVGN